MKIDDGKGRGFTVGVSPENRILAESKSVKELAYHAEEGEAFIFDTGHISLTNTSVFNGIIYIKNTDSTKNLYIDYILIESDQNFHSKMIKNPTAGTLITAGTAAAANNLRFDSGIVFVGDVLVGADGATVTDGSVLVSCVINGESHKLPFDGALIIAPNTSIALAFKPVAACTCCVLVVGWQQVSDRNTGA